MRALARREQIDSGGNWRFSPRMEEEHAKAAGFVLALLSVVALSVAPPTASAATPPGPKPPLTHVGRWITDAKGRAVILHGLNMVYKRPPYHPRAAGFGAEDARFLHRHGFDAIRLGLIYKGVEPRRPRHGHPAYDGRYLARIAATQRQLARDGVFSLLDFHQDLFNERFQGEGWPDWQVEDDGQPNPQNGFPGNYLTNPALNRAFDHFWANDRVGGVALQDEYAAAWKHVALRFGGRDYVLGYDLLNEPWPGSEWPTCAQPAGCPAFDGGPLAAMTRKASRAIRRVDRRHIVWQEPNVLFNFGSQSHLPAIGSKSGLSFHGYCLTPGAPDCPTTEARVFDNADDEAARTDRALLLTEFGATDDLSDIRRIAALADRHMVSWLEWAYCGCKDPTGSIPPIVEALVKNPARPPRAGNVKHAKLKALDRPYPQAVAGTPTRFSYERAGRRFSLRYSTRAPAGHRLPRGTETVVYVPRVHYRHGYRVAVSGATAKRRRPRARYVRLLNKPGARSVRLRIAPRRRAQ